MTDLQNVDPLVLRVAEARAAVSKRPDMKFPIGQLNQIGNNVYAYSGNLSVINAQTTLLEFVTNNDYIDAKFDIANGSGSGDDFRYYIMFNDIIVVHIYGGTSDVFNQFSMPKYLIVPPYTNVKLTAQNISTGSARAHTATMIGEIKQS